MNTYNNDDRTLDLKRLIVNYLKDWRAILLAAALCAVLLGAYAAVKAPGAVALTAEQKTAIQQQLDAANAELDSCIATAETGRAQLLSSSDIILAREEAIAEVEDRLAAQHDYLTTYEEMLREANRIRNSVPAGDRAELMAQITSLTEKIPAMKDAIAATEVQISTMQQELTDLEDSLETDLPEIVEEAEELIPELESRVEELEASLDPAPVGRSVGDVIKMAVIGAILGVFVTGCVYLWKVLRSKKIDGSDIIRERYHIPVLADLHVSKGSHSARIDLLLEKLNGESRQADQKTILPLLAAKLKSFCPDDSGEILLCGTVSDQAMAELCGELTKHMDGITLRAAGNPVVSAEAALAVKGCSALLVEETDGSLYPEVDEVLEQLTLSGAKVLGCVLV